MKSSRLASALAVEAAAASAAHVGRNCAVLLAEQLPHPMVPPYSSSRSGARSSRNLGARGERLQAQQDGTCRHQDNEGVDIDREQLSPVSIRGPKSRDTRDRTTSCWCAVNSVVRSDGQRIESPRESTGTDPWLIDNQALGGHNADGLVQAGAAAGLPSEPIEGNPNTCRIRSVDPCTAGQCEGSSAQSLLAPSPSAVANTYGFRNYVTGKSRILCPPGSTRVQQNPDPDQSGVQPARLQACSVAGFEEEEWLEAPHRLIPGTACDQWHDVQRNRGRPNEYVDELHQRRRIRRRSNISIIYNGPGLVQAHRVQLADCNTWWIRSHRRRGAMRTMRRQMLSTTTVKRRDR